MRVVVSGASGLLGSALVTALEASGTEVTRLVRRSANGPGEVSWDPAKGHLDPAQLEGADAVVHLAGAGIGARRWSEAYKKEIRDSRLLGTRTLARALAGLKRKPAVLLSGSAIGFYGDRHDETLDESGSRGPKSGPGSFLTSVVQDWEAAADPAAEAGIRVVWLRSGHAQSAEGGALGKVLPIFKAGLGAPLGSGRQWWSWISVPDWVSAVRFLMTDTDISGPVNLTAPNPVTNAAFTKALGRALHRPTWPLGVPGPVLRAALGELADDMLIGQRVLPRRLLDAGHVFAHPTVEDALKAVL
ncbi:TIGR01777 family oxidoreductase [Streptosporangiaceae bacterium NEAU-GS5]|nr:TIGR01777 family oxidoreductase [Streptosporangiaceae bacterium NEAU-GS5]